MAYVPVPFPMVRYDSSGVPLIVNNAADVALLPATVTALPQTPAAIVAFPPSLIAQVAKLPPTVAVALPPVLKQLIAVNTPKTNGNGRDH